MTDPDLTGRHICKRVFEQFLGPRSSYNFKPGRGWSRCDSAVPCHKARLRPSAASPGRSSRPHLAAPTPRVPLPPSTRHPGNHGEVQCAFRGRVSIRQGRNACPELTRGQTPEAVTRVPEGRAGFLQHHQTLPEDAFPCAQLLGSPVSHRHTD